MLSVIVNVLPRKHDVSWRKSQTGRWFCEYRRALYSNDRNNNNNYGCYCCFDTYPSVCRLPFVVSSVFAKKRDVTRRRRESLSELALPGTRRPRRYVFTSGNVWETSQFCERNALANSAAVRKFVSSSRGRARAVKIAPAHRLGLRAQL